MRKVKVRSLARQPVSDYVGELSGIDKRRVFERRKGSVIRDRPVAGRWSLTPQTERVRIPLPEPDDERL